MMEYHRIKVVGSAMEKEILIGGPDEILAMVRGIKEEIEGGVNNGMGDGNITGKA